MTDDVSALDTEGIRLCWIYVIARWTIIGSSLITGYHRRMWRMASSSVSFLRQILMANYSLLRSVSRVFFLSREKVTYSASVDKLFRLNILKYFSHLATVYEVRLKTGSVSGGGTNARVYLTLIGANSSSGEFVLANPKLLAFTKGHEATFRVSIGCGMGGGC